MKLHTYLKEIFDIAKENNVSWDIGKDMFLANVQQGTGTYAGADDVDYSDLHSHYDELADTGTDFVDIVHEKYFDIVELRKNGQMDEAVKLIGG